MEKENGIMGWKIIDEERPMPTRDEIAIAILEEWYTKGFAVRISNKTAIGYWWVYCGDKVVQGNNVVDAIFEMNRLLKHNPGYVGCNGH